MKPILNGRVFNEAGKCHHIPCSKLDSYDLVRLIGASADLGSIASTKLLHSYALKSGFWCSVFVATSLISAYAKLDFLPWAHQLFEEIPKRNVVAWNALVSGYARSGYCLEAFDVFCGIFRSNVRPTAFTFSAVLAACCQLGSLRMGSAIHGEVVKCGFEFNVVVGNCLIDMYGKCGFVDDAILAFHKMDQKDCVSWNSVISAAARNRDLGVALDFFNKMPAPDTISYNEVISGLAQFGNIEDAVKILWCMPTPDSSSWNSIISGYIRRNQQQEAWKFYCQMHSNDVVKDEFTFSSILKGAADMSALGCGIVIHCCSIKYGLNSYLTVGSALIDMYAKCGAVNHSEIIFMSLPKRNLVSYNAMLWGYAYNGRVKEVVELFKQMKTINGVPPDHITFLGVLSICRQDKVLLHDGIRYFDLMHSEYGISPTAELCSCMIDLLGQLGELQRAKWMIYDLGFQSSTLVWMALLGACEASGDIGVAEVAASKVVELKGEDEFVYVLLSNIYASKGRWADVMKIRKMMREGGVRKQAGRSWIEV